LKGDGHDRNHVPKDPIDPQVLRERLRVGAIIRSLREWRDLRQEGLEQLSGVSWRHISRIENGDTNAGIDSYIKIARALNVPLSSLFDGTPETTIGGGSGGGASPR
jgi:DNA-binding XRE family transcriptional regulator